MKSYKFEQFEQALADKVQSGTIKTLRDEVAILRMLTEATVNQCQDDQEKLMLRAPQIANMVMKTEKLVTSCHALEAKAGIMIDAQTAIGFANDLIEIISKHVTNPTTLKSISSEIDSALVKLSGSA